MSRMISGANGQNRIRRERRGVSFVEILGLLTAMTGGLILGAVYLGVDMKSASLQLLARTGVIDAPSTATAKAASDPAQATSPAPIQSLVTLYDASSATASVTVAEETSETTSETADDVPGVQADATALEKVGDLTQALKTTLEAELAEVEADKVTAEEGARLTQAYWEALCQLINEEAERRQPTRIEEADLELFDFLEFRENGHAAAAEKLQMLNLRGVDPHVAAYARTVRKWHESGANLFRRARQLLTDAPTSQNSGPLAQGWRSAATQHRMEEKLLAEKHRAVAAHLENAAARAAN